MKILHDDIILNNICKYINTKYSDVKIYLFGSYLTYPNIAKDIDLLIIYNDINKLDDIERYIKEVVQYPVHILSMTIAEEKQFNFIEVQNALLLISENNLTIAST